MDITKLTSHEIEAKIDSILFRADHPEFWLTQHKNRYIQRHNCTVSLSPHRIHTNIKINAGITFYIPYTERLISNYSQRILNTTSATPVYDYMLKVAKLMLQELNLYLCVDIDPHDMEAVFNYYWYGATPDNALKIVNDPANTLYMYIDPRLQYLDDSTAKTISDL